MIFQFSRGQHQIVPHFLKTFLEKQAWWRRLTGVPTTWICCFGEGVSGGWSMGLITV